MAGLGRVDSRNANLSMEQPDGTQEIGKFMVRIGVIILICSYFWTQLIGMDLGLASAACHALVAPAVMLLAFRRGVGARVIPWLTLFALPVGMSTVSYALNGGGTEADPLLYQVPHGQRRRTTFTCRGFCCWPAACALRAPEGGIGA